jgi:hypothetical protein
MSFSAVLYNDVSPIIQALSILYLAYLVLSNYIRNDAIMYFFILFGIQTVINVQSEFKNYKLWFYSDSISFITCIVVVGYLLFYKK